VSWREGEGGGGLPKRWSRSGLFAEVLVLETVLCGWALLGIVLEKI
jgi:hypothetical protein